MFSTELGLTLEAAFREAASRRHAFFCLEHLLYALTFDEQIMEILRSAGADLQLLRKDLESFFDKHVEVIPVKSQRGVVAEPAQTPAVQRVLQRAIMHVRSAQKDIITPAEVFVAIFTEEDSHAVFYLAKQRITRLDIVNLISHGALSGSQEREDLLASSDDEEDDFGTARPARSILEQFTEDLTALARAHKLDPVIGRENEIERALKVLCRRQKNNPLFLGEPGVGKTAMAHAIASRIVAGEIPEQLQGAEVFLLNMGTLVAGTKFRGEFEERVRRVILRLSTAQMRSYLSMNCTRLWEQGPPGRALLMQPTF